MFVSVMLQYYLKSVKLYCKQFISNKDGDKFNKEFEEHFGRQLLSLNQEAKNVSCDIAMVPIGGTYTMDAKKAAELINDIKPKVAIPTHYGSIVGKKEDAKIFTAAVKPPVKVVVKMQ